MFNTKHDRISYKKCECETVCVCEFRPILPLPLKRVYTSAHARHSLKSKTLVERLFWKTELKDSLTLEKKREEQHEEVYILFSEIGKYTKKLKFTRKTVYKLFKIKKP